MMLSTQSRRRTNSEALGTCVRPERLPSPPQRDYPSPTCRKARVSAKACLYLHCIYQVYQEVARALPQCRGVLKALGISLKLNRRDYVQPVDASGQGPPVLFPQYPLQPVDEVERVARGQFVGAGVAQQCLNLRLGRGRRD